MRIRVFVLRDHFSIDQSFPFQVENEASGEWWSSGMAARSESTNVSDKQLQSKILEMQRVKCLESMRADTKRTGEYNSRTLIRPCE